MSIQGIEIVHALPGRVRLKVARLKGDPALAGEAQIQLKGVPGINEIEANAITGSILIHYDKEQLMSPEPLAALSGTLSALLPEVDTAHLPAAWLTAVTDGGGVESSRGPGLLANITGQAGQLTQGMSVNFLIPLTLLFLGIRSLWLSEKLAHPAWFDYFWFAFSTMIMLNRKWLEGSSVSQ